MISIKVRLENNHMIEYNTVVITEEELRQLACNKARGMYTDGFYTSISADNSIKVLMEK